jgi:nucleotide-binding universal stress UspA family protein
MGTLVVGYDGTDGARAALRAAVELVGSTPTKLLHLSQRPVLVVPCPD